MAEIHDFEGPDKLRTLRVAVRDISPAWDVESGPDDVSVMLLRPLPEHASDRKHVIAHEVLNLLEDKDSDFQVTFSSYGPRDEQTPPRWAIAVFTSSPI